MKNKEAKPIATAENFVAVGYSLDNTTTIVIVTGYDVKIYKGD